MRFIETTTKQTESCAEPERDKGGNDYRPRYTARMMVRVPQPMHDHDIVKLWDTFTKELREVMGYSEEMRERVEAERAQWDRFLFKPQQDQQAEE